MISHRPKTLLISVLITLLLSQAAIAACGASSSSSTGGTISAGNQPLRSRPLDISIPARALINHVNWHVSILSLPPYSLQIKLCSPSKCIFLESLAGQKDINLFLKAQGPIYFIYSVNYSGLLLPPLNVVKNQLTVQWCTPEI